MTSSNIELELSLASFLLDATTTSHTFQSTDEARAGWNIIKKADKELETLYASGFLSRPTYTFSEDGLEVSKVSQEITSYNPYAATSRQSSLDLLDASESRSQYAPALDAIAEGGIVTFSSRKELAYFRTLCNRKGIKIKASGLNVRASYEGEVTKAAIKKPSFTITSPTSTNQSTNPTPDFKELL